MYDAPQFGVESIGGLWTSIDKHIARDELLLDLIEKKLTQSSQATLAKGTMPRPGGFSLPLVAARLTLQGSLCLYSAPSFSKLTSKNPARNKFLEGAL